MRKTLSYLPLVFFIIIALLFSIKLLTPTKFQSPLIGEQISYFSLQSNIHSNHELASKDLDGTLYLINFFTSWCNYCHLEHNFLVSLSKKKILPIYGIAVKDNPLNLTDFLNNYGNPYQDVGLDNDGRVAIQFGIKGFPETILVNNNGRIIYHLRGILTEKIYNKEIAPLIKKELNDISIHE